MDANLLNVFTDLSGNALAVAVLVFFIRYFITREEKREAMYLSREEKRDLYFGEIFKENTLALKKLTEIVQGLHK